MTRSWRAGIRVVLTVLATLLVVSAVTFVLLHLSPGTPGAARLGSAATMEQIAEYNASVGYDDPLPVQYLRWLGAVAHGDFGESWLDGNDVGANLVEKGAVTLQLALGGMLIGTVLGLLIGMIQGLRPYGIFDRITQSSTAAVLAVPPIWLGLILSAVVAVRLKLLPVAGYVDPTEDLAGFVRKMILPWLAVGLPLAALVARQVRVSCVSVMESDFVRSAIGLGLSPTRVLFRHALRPTLTPIATVLGIQVAVIIGTAVLIENVFSLPGLGTWLVTAALGRDQPVLLAGVLACAFAVVLARVVTERARRWLDPRSAG